VSYCLLIDETSDCWDVLLPLLHAVTSSISLVTLIWCDNWAITTETWLFMHTNTLVLCWLQWLVAVCRQLRTYSRWHLATWPLTHQARSQQCRTSLSSGQSLTLVAYMLLLLLLLLLRKFIECRIARRPQVHYVSSGNCQLFKCQLSMQGRAQGLKIWTHNRWGAERSMSVRSLKSALWPKWTKDRNCSVSYYRKWKLISSEVGVKLKNRENSKFSEKNWSKFYWTHVRPVRPPAGAPVSMYNS